MKSAASFALGFLLGSTRWLGVCLVLTGVLHCLAVWVLK